MDATAKVAQLKALQNSLSLCSAAVKNHVAKKKLLEKTKKPITIVDLAKLADGVGLSDATLRTLDRILDIGTTTTRQLNSVLPGSDV